MPADHVESDGIDGEASEPPGKRDRKFWSAAGSDAMLQLRADYLSDTEPMTGFWEGWQKSATGQRRYASAS